MEVGAAVVMVDAGAAEVAITVVHVCMELPLMFRGCCGCGGVGAAAVSAASWAVVVLLLL